MTVRFFVAGRVFVNVWSGASILEDAKRTLLEARQAHARLGLSCRLAGVGILDYDWQRPGQDVRELMSESHKEMRTYHDSIHIVPLMKRTFLTSAAISIATLLFSGGTGGRLHINKTVDEALQTAELYGELLVARADVLAHLRRMKIPIEPQ